MAWWGGNRVGHRDRGEGTDRAAATATNGHDRLQCGAEGHRPADLPVDLAEGADDVDVGDVTLAPAAVLRGCLVGGDDPLAERCVQLLFEDETLGASPSRLGEFPFPNAPVGRVVLVAQPCARLDLVLHAAEERTGVVVDARSGAALEGSSVALGSARVRTDAEGRFTLTRPEARVVARVLGASGSPALDGTTVVLVRRGERGGAAQTSWGTVSDGQVTFQRMVAGRYDLLVPAEDSPRGVWGEVAGACARQPFTIADGETLEFVLRCDG